MRRAVTVGNFDVHNRKWLIGSSDASAIGRYVEHIGMVNNFCQLVDSSRIPKRTGDRPLILVSILTSFPSLFTRISLLPALLLHRCIVSCSIRLTRHDLSSSWRHLCVAETIFENSYFRILETMAVLPSTFLYFSKFTDAVLRDENLILHFSKSKKSESPLSINQVIML